MIAAHWESSDFENGSHDHSARVLSGSFHQDAHDLAPPLQCLSLRPCDSVQTCCLGDTLSYQQTLAHTQSLRIP